ncbi:MAG: hypothetical protein AB7U51_11750 [Arcobacter sp.]|uniref:hypothetical protein n=1 Tax=Arcobacter sp. TaxID=1872629 RepID=UPI003CFBECFB
MKKIFLGLIFSTYSIFAVNYANYCGGNTYDLDLALKISYECGSCKVLGKLSYANTPQEILYNCKKNLKENPNSLGGNRTPLQEEACLDICLAVNGLTIKD